jgi:hypothetical protein
MKWYFITTTSIIASLYLNECSVSKARPGNEINGVRLTISLPLSDTNGSIMQADHSRWVFYYKNMELFKIPVGNSEFENGELKRAWETYMYLIRRKEEPKGILFYHDSIEQEQVDIDSFKKKSTMTSFDVFYGATKWSDSLIGKENLPGNITLVKFLPRKKLDESYSDSIMMYFRRDLWNVGYSLCPELDYEYKMKFCKIRMVYNGNPLSEHAYYRNKREIMLKMEPAELNDKDEILKQFKLFETLNKASIEGK